MAVDDLVEAEEFPEPESKPHVAEPACVGPADRTRSDAHDLGVVWNRDLIVIGVGEEAELLGIALAVVDDHGALHIVVEFAQVCDHMLPRRGLGTRTLDQGWSSTVITQTV